MYGVSNSIFSGPPRNPQRALNPHYPRLSGCTPAGFSCTTQACGSEKLNKREWKDQLRQCLSALLDFNSSL